MCNYIRHCIKILMHGKLNIVPDTIIPLQRLWFDKFQVCIFVSRYASAKLKWKNWVSIKVFDGLGACQIFTKKMENYIVYILQ